MTVRDLPCVVGCMTGGLEVFSKLWNLGAALSALRLPGIWRSLLALEIHNRQPLALLGSWQAQEWL
jgi:hypothetical protein